MLNQLKNKLTKEIVYFKFFTQYDNNIFWYTPTIESLGFDFGNINDFTPLKTTWEEIRNENVSNIKK